MSHLKDRTFGPNQHFQKIVATFGKNQFDTEQFQPEEEDDIEALHNSILRDPRYIRFSEIWDPKWTNKPGVKHKVKNFIDPIHLPFIGTMIMWKRGKATEKQKEEIEDLLKETEKTTQAGEDTFVVAHEAGQNIKSTSKSMFFPIVYLFPGGDPIISKTDKGVTKTSTKSSPTQDPAKIDTSEIWGATKAFLLYLGLPRTTDKIYVTWEETRIRLKQLLGANPNDDLKNMQPKGEILKTIEESEELKGGYDLQTLNIPILVLLWRLYDCWDRPGEKFFSKKHKMEKEDCYRAEDERKVLEMIHTVDPHIQKLEMSSLKDVARLLRTDASTGYGKHKIFSFLKDRSEGTREKRLQWLMETFVKKMIDAETGWGYFRDTTEPHQNELLAVVFFERAEQTHYDLSELLSTFSGMIKLQYDYMSISSRLSWEAGVMKHFIDRKNPRGILHMFGCQNSTDGHQALIKLIHHEIRYTSIPSYCQEYEVELDRRSLLEQAGFEARSDLSPDEQTRLVLEHKPPTDPLRLKIYEYDPPPRDENDYLVPKAVQSAPLPPETSDLTAATTTTTTTTTSTSTTSSTSPTFTYPEPIIITSSPTADAVPEPKTRDTTAPDTNPAEPA